jgi:cytochrome c553
MRMTVTGEEAICLSCHGTDSSRSQMRSRGFLVGQTAELADISAVLAKPYNHPVLTVANVHRQMEKLPEENVSAARHAECVDCHDPHQVAVDAPFRGIPGRRIVNTIVEIEHEYELCYKCHADSANLPGGSTNKRTEFKTSNRSYHPVEGEGANSYVISLKAPYAARADHPGDVSIISCRDCHGNDDPSGPRGPHGSNYEGLLIDAYEMRDGNSESQYAYALCYRCHERNSILGDESFPKHSLHVTGGPSGVGTSCFTCHDAHGSPRYQALIRFNDQVVRPTVTGKLEYKTVSASSRSGSCTLLCHGVEHLDRSY